ncbi:MAG: 3'-5' exonuclease [Bacteroidota bacterium]
MSEVLKSQSIAWAQEVLLKKDKYVILDSETTGLKKNDVIVQLAVIDLNGNELFNSLIRPTKRKRISADATSIHGISMKDLKDQPSLSEVIDDFILAIGNKTVLIYNAEYDTRLLEQTCDQDEIASPHFRSRCVMLKYSSFVGEWNEYRGDYKWQRLPGGDHSAIGDCRATLAVIKKMAAYRTPVKSKSSSFEFSDQMFYLGLIMFILYIIYLFSS